MRLISNSLSDLGYTLSSGGAIGSDLAFEQGSGDKKKIFKAEDATSDALEISSKFHSKWHQLDRYTQNLHGRNAMIILGEDLKTPVNFVVTWTKNGKDVGGTGQGIRIANHYGIKIYNIFFEEELEALRNLVRDLRGKKKFEDFKKTIDLTRDGLDHINIYSKANTKLGRFLTNFATSPFECVDGRFNSIEGYWYWLGSKKDAEADKLRLLSGFEAKAYGREIKCEDWGSGEDFKDKIKAAISNKIFSNQAMAHELLKSKLPLIHYYNYSGRVIFAPEGDWVIDHISDIRSSMQNLKNLITEKGSALSIPENAVVAHSCNCLGDWGAGFALLLKKERQDAYLDQVELCSQFEPIEVLGKYRFHVKNQNKTLSLFSSIGYGANKSSPEVILKNTRISLMSFLEETGERLIYMPKINSGFFKVNWDHTYMTLTEACLKYPELKIVIREL